MKNFCLALLFSFFSLGLSAQGFQVPRDVKLQTPEDYAFYEVDILLCADWLIETPLSSRSQEENQNVSAFLMAWIAGAPNVNVLIDNNIMFFAENTPSALLPFVAGWIKFVLESGDDDDKVGANLAAVEAVITYYSVNRDVLPRDGGIEKMVDLQQKGKLRARIEKQVKQ